MVDVGLRDLWRKHRLPFMVDQHRVNDDVAKLILAQFGGNGLALWMYKKRMDAVQKNKRKPPEARAVASCS